MNIVLWSEENDYTLTVNGILKIILSNVNKKFDKRRELNERLRQ
jgi:hypothetical protein